MVKSEFINEVVNDVEDVMSDTLIALADIVERSLPMGTENEKQRQELTLSLANAKYHEPIKCMMKWMVLGIWRYALILQETLFSRYFNKGIICKY